MYKVIDKQGNFVTSKKTGQPFEYTTYKTAFLGRDALEHVVKKHRRPLHVVGTAS